MNDQTNESGFLNRWSQRKSQLKKGSKAPNNASERSLTRNSVSAQTSSDELNKVFADEVFDDASIESPVNTVLIEAECAPVVTEGGNLTSQIHAETGRESVETIDDVEEVLLCDADMPAIESLSSESDLSQFFNKGVSAALRKAALRHVFQQPVYNLRDGLNDYDGDYTVFEPLGDIVTSDMKWHTARKERERLEAEALAEEQRLAQEAERLEGEDKNDECLQEESAEAECEEITDDVTEAEAEADVESGENELLDAKDNESQRYLESQSETLDSACVDETLNVLVASEAEEHNAIVQSAGEVAVASEGHCDDSHHIEQRTKSVDTNATTDDTNKEKAT